MNSPIENKIILYQTQEGNQTVSVLYKEDTFWLTQKAMAELFSVGVPAINKHLTNIFNDGELMPDSVISKMEITASDDKTYLTQFYNLDAIIAVGYRVNSKEATQFRIWATKTLREYIIKGFVLNDDLLKNGRAFGKDYFDELLERIREIRASERRFYQKITDIFMQCSIDYDKDSEITHIFYKTVQNKFHWAITGHTAPEIIHGRSDAERPHMGLTTWKNAPQGKILRSDVTVAKNYLSEDELKKLNRLVNMYLDFAENQAERQIPMTMQDWADKLDDFLRFNEYHVLGNAGTISKVNADKRALSEYEKFRIKQDQDYISDFDKEIKKIKKQ